MRLAGQSYQQVLMLLQSVSQACAPSMTTVSQQHHQCHCHTSLFCLMKLLLFFRRWRCGSRGLTCVSPHHYPPWTDCFREGYHGGHSQRLYTFLTEYRDGDGERKCITNFLSIFQVTGPSGCGKSQVCMMLSVLATLPKCMGGLDSGVIYIDTESAFSAER